MKVLFFIFSVFFTCSIFAQDRHLTVIIDTIRFEIIKEEYKLTLKPCGYFFNKDEFFIHKKEVSTDVYPNYQNSFDIPNGATTLELPIDSNGSCFCIMNIHSINSDTLRINTITIYNTKKIDSTFTNSFFYKADYSEMNNKRYREKNKKEGSNFNPIPPPKKIEVIINGRKYETTLKLESDLIEVTTGSGYNKRRPFKRNGDEKKRLKRYTYGQYTYQYIWKGNIVLIENKKSKTNPTFHKD